MNLTDIFEAFTDDEKEVMVKAWSSYYSHIGLALLPFVNRRKMKVAVNDYFIDLSKMTFPDIRMEQNLLKKLKVQ